jgi:hypothetical protein
MKGYIIISIGNDPEDDYICATGFNDHIRKVFLNKKSAEKFCEDLQKSFDEDDCDNPYEFRLEEIEIIEH